MKFTSFLIVHYVLPAGSSMEDHMDLFTDIFEFWACSYCLHLNSTIFCFLSKYLEHLVIFTSFAITTLFFKFQPVDCVETLLVDFDTSCLTHDIWASLHGAMLGGQKAPHILFLCMAHGQRVVFMFPLHFCAWF